MSATHIAAPSYRYSELDSSMRQRPAPDIAGDSYQQALLARLRAVNAAMLEAVLAGDGLERVAELAAVAAGGPVALHIPRLTADLHGGESPPSEDSRWLKQWVAERVRGCSEAVPEAVLVEVPVRFRQEIVGVVALLRGDKPPGAGAVEFLHLAAGAAVMALAIEEAKEETEQALRGSFLEELRSRQNLDGADLVRRASRLGCDLSRGAVILCAELTTDRPRLTVATIAEEHDGALAQQLHGFGTDAPARVYAALPATVGDGSAAATLASARRIAARLERHAIVGLSSFHADPDELDCATQEAELMLEVLHQSGMPITDEIRGGTYPLLFRMVASHPDEVRSFYEVTIAPIVRFDDQYRGDLLHTLQAYLDANCNMNATASAIFAHRHTVAYRLERVHELTGLDPMRSEHRERLGLGLKIHRIIAPRVAPADQLGQE
jgi:sugar diacid utilization regulator